MWTLFIVTLILCLLTKFILNVIEIFNRVEEIISQRQFTKSLQDNILDQITKGLSEEEE